LNPIGNLLLMSEAIAGRETALDLLIWFGRYRLEGLAESPTADGEGLSGAAESKAAPLEGIVCEEARHPLRLFTHLCNWCPAAKRFVNRRRCG
jgi:hypothetical protein